MELWGKRAASTEAAVQPSQIYADVSPLLTSRTDPLIPIPSRQVMQMTVEMCASTYEMMPDPWVEAGWCDVSLQVDGEIMTGLGQQDRGILGKLTDALKMKYVQHQLDSKNTFAALRTSLRQKEHCDTGKAMVMAHRAPDGRYVISISFMGTGANLSDWLSNLRFVREDGWHRGFLQLTEHFERNEGRITFPDVAKELGMRMLTLADIIAECTRPESRFTLWLSGHSQGGAVVQAYCRRLMARGVDPQYLIGCGLASPTTRKVEAGAEKYPLWHVVNTEDVVPRVGAEYRLGRTLYYTPDESFRRASYRWQYDEQSMDDRARILPIVRTINDMSSGLIVGAGVIEAISKLPSELKADLMQKDSALLRRIPVERMLKVVDGSIDRWLSLAIEKLNKTYREIYGNPIPPYQLHYETAKIYRCMMDIGPKRFVQTMADLMMDPHRCSSRADDPMGSYAWIAEACWDKLRCQSTGDISMYVLHRCPSIYRRRTGRRYSENHQRYRGNRA